MLFLVLTLYDWLSTRVDLVLNLFYLIYDNVLFLCLVLVLYSRQVFSLRINLNCL